MRSRCSKRGNDGRGVTSLRLGTGVCCATVTVRCSHCGEMLWRADSSSVEQMLRGKRRLRFEKTEGSAESTQAFVIGDTRRKESLDTRGRKE